jgi:hypothetical protein
MRCPHGSCRAIHGPELKQVDLLNEFMAKLTDPDLPQADVRMGSWAMPFLACTQEVLHCAQQVMLA